MKLLDAMAQAKDDVAPLGADTPVTEFHVFLCSGSREVIRGATEVVLGLDEVVILDGSRIVATYPAGCVYFISSGKGFSPNGF